MKILDNNGNYVGILFVLLLHSNKYSFLPDLVEELGEDKSLDFLERFAGKTIKFPSIAEFTSLARSVTIYIKCKNAPHYKLNVVMENLASRYCIDVASVQNIYHNTKKDLEENLKLKFIVR
jgi:hypothetical protein